MPGFGHRLTDGGGTDAGVGDLFGKAIPVAFITGSGPEVRERLPMPLSSAPSGTYRTKELTLRTVE